MQATAGLSSSYACYPARQASDWWEHMGRELPASDWSGLRYLIVPIALFGGEVLVLWGTLAVLFPALGLPTTFLLLSAIGVGIVILVGGIGLWLGRRRAAYLLALGSAAAAIGSLAVASGVIFRDVRGSVGGPALPLVVAVIAGSLALLAISIAIGSRSGLRPMTGVRSAILGITDMLVVPPLLGMAYVSASIGGGNLCDGTVPLWMLPDDYDGGGCVELRPPWEALYPWHWGEWHEVCLGMCLDMEVYPGRTPD